MWQPGQMADAMSTSREISSAQPVSVGGRLLPPVWLTFLKQPLAVVQAGSPNWLRYTPRSASAVGSLNASTIAMVWLAEPFEVSLYAERRSAGLSPCGLAAFGRTPLPGRAPERTYDRQLAVPAFAAAQTLLMAGAAPG